jgi:hypothetical protein
MIRRGQERAAPGEAIRTAVAIGLGALLLTWPAFYDGYPLLYDDSASYLDTIDPRAAIWARPIFYTVFLRPFHMHVSLWPAIFAQSLILAVFVYIAARAVCGRIPPASYMLLMAVLSLTMLPWLTSMIMPHAFTGIVVLGLCLLGLYAERLRSLEKWYVALLVTGSITVHNSHLALALCVLAALIAVMTIQHAAVPRLGRAALIAAPIALALIAQIAVNSYARGTVAVAPAASTFLLGRFVADGTAVAYLRDACPKRKYALCDYVDQLPANADEFLWNRNGPFRRLGGPAALQDETRAIVLGTLRTYPLRQLAITASHVARQLFDWRIDSIIQALDPMKVPNYPIRLYIQNMFPREYPAYMASRQSTDRLPLATIDALHGTVTVASLFAGLMVAIAFYRRREPQLLGLAVVIASAWVGNAVITASISGVFGHYQGRLAWVVTFYAVVGALCLARERLQRSDRNHFAGAIRPPLLRH